MSNNKGQNSNVKQSISSIQQSTLVNNTNMNTFNRTIIPIEKYDPILGKFYESEEAAKLFFNKNSKHQDLLVKHNGNVFSYLKLYKLPSVQKRCL